MELSWDIVLALNSIIDGKRLRGIKFNYVEPNEEKTFVKETLRKMIDQELALESGELTEKGELIKLTLEQYKASQAIVYLNRIRIGLSKADNICPALIPLYKAGRLSIVDVRLVNKQEIFLAMIEAYPILCQGHLERDIKYKTIKYLRSVIMEHDEKEIMLLAKECSFQNENYICIIEDDKIKKIDAIRNSIQEVGGGDIRHHIAAMLDLTWM